MGRVGSCNFTIGAQFVFVAPRARKRARGFSSRLATVHGCWDQKPTRGGKRTRRADPRARGRAACCCVAARGRRPLRCMCWPRFRCYHESDRANACMCCEQATAAPERLLVGIRSTRERHPRGTRAGAARGPERRWSDARSGRSRKRTENEHVHSAGAAEEVRPPPLLTPQAYTSERRTFRAKASATSSRLTHSTP